jgi:hypothetical protein
MRVTSFRGDPYSKNGGESGVVRKLECDCDERIGIEIDSFRLFDELRSFFEAQVKAGVYKDIPVEKPFYIGYSDIQTIEWFASKWYHCETCGCLWEFDYPDFPAMGLVRKFPDGIYRRKEVQGNK